tara:strand:- start:468 stop:1256 length:789 start_codon:yes stop_codon:yes gene_type:complete
MNELSEFFSSVAKEKKRVEKEKIRFTPRVNVSLSDLSGFFGTITEAKREHVIIAKRDSTKLDALKGFFNRLDQFETALQENIDKQKETPKDDNWEDTESYEIEQIEKDKTESEKKQEELEPIVETKVDRFPTAEERWPRAGETAEIKQVEVKPVSYFNKKTRPEPKVEETDVASLAQAMSGIIKKPEQLDEQPQLSDLEKLQREFTQFRKLVTMQMASIGGGGEVRLLNLDDVDTSSLGNGKFLVYNGSTQKLEFTDQVDGN